MPTDVLAGLDTVEGVSAEAGSGSVTVTVTRLPSTPAASTAEVELRVGAFAVPCRIVGQGRAEDRGGR
ncbi:hypothetical protein ABZZ80_12165 [Streptomyces sp. NPDC006356]